MADPANTLRVQYIDGSLGNYGPVYQDDTRPGADGHRKWYVGRRGQTVTRRIHQFYTSESAAVADKAQWEAWQGSEVFLTIALRNNLTYRVWLDQVDVEEPRAIGHTTYSWRLVATVTFHRSV